MTVINPALIHVQHISIVAISESDTAEHVTTLFTFQGNRDFFRCLISTVFSFLASLLNLEPDTIWFLYLHQRITGSFFFR